MSWTDLKKTVLIIFSLILLTTTGVAQSANSVTITVSSTEYDNPTLTGLKEYLKSNSKVKGLKSTFNNSVATLSFIYIGGADALWDEIPVDKKQGLKLSSVDSKNIKLQVLKPSAVSTSTAKTNSKDCGCEYYPICNPDDVKTYNGKEYKGIRNTDESITYYNCDKGKITMLWYSKKAVVKVDNYGDYYDAYEYTTNTKVIFDPSSPVNEEWSKTLSGMIHIYKNLQKGITITVDEKVYTNVEVVQFTLGVVISGITYIKKEDYAKCAFRPSDNVDYYNVVSQKHYYAKGIGLIKTEDILPQLYFEHLQGEFLTNSSTLSVEEKSTIEAKVLYDKYVLENKGIDERLLGWNWRYTESGGFTVSFKRNVRFAKNNLFYWYASKLTENPLDREPITYYYSIKGDTLRYIPEFYSQLQRNGIYNKSLIEYSNNVYRVEVDKPTSSEETLKTYYFDPANKKFSQYPELYIKIPKN